MVGPDLFTPIINSYLPEPQASLLNGILFGVKLHTSAHFYNQLKQVGLIHLVVLSGTNVSLLAVIVASLTSCLGKRKSILISMLTVLLFLGFVGPQAPVVRAVFMYFLTSVAIIFGRKSLALYSLFLSALITGLIWPQWPWTISFQLSYAATLGLILFNKSTVVNSSLFQYCKQEFKTSLSAQVFTIPIIFWYFKQVSLIAPVANILVAWLIGPLMIFGFLTAFLGKIYYLLGVPFSFICYILLSYMVLMVEFLSQLPFSYFSF